MFFLPRSLRRRWVLSRRELSPALWHAALDALPLAQGLTEDDEARLRDLVLLFLHEKALETVGEQVLDEAMRLRIGILACLPILNLGLDYYRGWYSVVVYPSGFVARHEEVDEIGAVHSHESPLVGEAWEQGPVILSWEDVERAGELDGYNVAIHEFAHKIDMLFEGPNGLPPLHRDMPVEEWSAAFSAAFEDLGARYERGEETEIDPYAAESPGEFFAVVSEAFFEIPATLQETYPGVYEQLRRFYRQDPLQRLPAAGAPQVQEGTD